MKQAPSYWYHPGERPPPHMVMLSWLFRLLSGLRRAAYNARLLPSHALPVPVIVVGNINVGGTGKTPLVIWLVKLLQKAGYTPGIVSRGYGGQAQRWPQQVRADSDPQMVGDEPVLLAQHCDCPIVAAPDRVAAAKSLLAHTECDVIVCDDGLQHYRLRRDMELVVVDGARRFGNGCLLPAGPLRELPKRLKSVDFVVNNGGPADKGEVLMKTVQGDAINLADSGVRRPLADFIGRPLHALAGIGHPQRFFEELRGQGLTPTTHPFADHHSYSAEDLDIADEAELLMTEKDAVKCRQLSLGERLNKLWWVPLAAHLDEKFAHHVLMKLQRVIKEKSN